MQLCSEHRGSVTCAGLGAGPDQRQGCKRLLCDTTNKSPPPLLPALCSAAPARCVCALAWDGCEGGEDGWATGTPGRGDSTQPLPRQRLLSLSPCRGNSKRCSVEAGRWSSERACRWDREGRAAIFIYLHKPRRNTHKQVYRIAYLRASVGNVQMCHCAHITHRRHTYIHVHTGMAPSTTAHGATARGCGLQGGQQGGSRQGLAPPRALCPPSTLIPGVEEQSSPRRQHNNDAAPTSFLQDLLKHREHEPKHTEYKVNVSVLVTGAINLLRKVTTVQSVSQNSSPPGTKAAIRPPSALLQQPPRPPPSSRQLVAAERMEGSPAQPCSPLCSMEGRLQAEGPKAGLTAAQGWAGSGGSQLLSSSSSSSLLPVLQQGSGGHALAQTQKGHKNRTYREATEQE